MDFKSMLIGGLGTALLFASLGATTVETPNHWQPLKVLTIEATDLSEQVFYTFDVVLCKYNPDRINHSTGEKFEDPKDHWEYTIDHAGAIVEK